MLISSGMDVALFGILGLLIGSFLNVVIHRLPIMMEAQWKAECAEQNDLPLPAPEPLNLMQPGSRCPHCGHAISWHENIPVLSYLFLGGKCSACTAAISLRYPLVELSTAVLFSWCAWKWGATPTALLWSAFSATLLALALIDWDTTLLPDVMTLPLLWAGLLVAALQWSSVSLASAFWGAVVGYLSLWLIYWAFKLITGKEGMGFGDFKLYGALGAWFGWQALVPIILMSSVIGAVIGIAMKFSSGLREGGYLPFGPFLAGAGLAVMVYGPDTLLHLIGL